MPKSNGKRKTKLVIALQHKLKEYAQAGREGDMRAVQTELAYLLRIGELRRLEDERIRARFHLAHPLVTLSEIFNADVAQTAEPLPSKQEVAGSVPAVRSHDPIPLLPPVRPKTIERERWAFVRFCVHCDREMQQIGDSEWRCVNSRCEWERERA